MAESVEIFAQNALLSRGWATDVALTISACGDIVSSQVNARAAPGQKSWPLILPGMINAHSHAFQRAIAGMTEGHDGKSGDFWSWRQALYDMLPRLAVDDVKNIATRLYIELLKGGYTSVAEFHYLHHLGGKEETPGLASARALCEAATETGIGLTLLPTLYRYSNFGGRAPTPSQKPFIHDLDGFLELVSTMSERVKPMSNQSLGVAFHSLRAVTTEDITFILRQLNTGDYSIPKHIHISEQTKEVQDCLASSGNRPIELLMERVDVDATWTLVHATHCSPKERDLIARSGALVSLCPTTEANLGDGFFPFEEFLNAGGRWAIGSDSHVCTEAAEELRLLDYTGRLRGRTRAGALQGKGGHVGTALWSAAVQNGAAACGRKTGALDVGARADLIAVDVGHPQLTGRSSEQILDAALFGGCGPLFRDVMVGGQWVVRDGKHPLERQANEAYKSSLSRLF